MSGEEKKIILIVDDDIGFLVAIQKRLLCSGYDVKTARSGAEALSLAFEQRLDCLLLDVQMPGDIDGFGVASAIHADSRTVRLPMIVLTGSADANLKRRCEELGVTFFLAKPIDTDLLLRTLDGIFAKDDLGQLRALSQAKRRQPTAQILDRQWA